MALGDFTSRTKQELALARFAAGGDLGRVQTRVPGFGAAGGVAYVMSTLQPSGKGYKLERADVLFDTDAEAGTVEEEKEILIEVVAGNSRQETMAKRLITKGPTGGEPLEIVPAPEFRNDFVLYKVTCGKESEGPPAGLLVMTFAPVV